MPNINYGTAAPGLGRLAAALGGGGYQRGYDNELNLQSKLAQAMAAIDAHTASADLNRAKAAGEQSQQAMQTPEAVRRTAMLSQGIPLDEAPEVETYERTGQLGGKYRPLAEGLPGPVAPRPDWESRLGEVARAAANTQRALALGDKNSENVAKAGSIERGDRLSDAIINGTANRNTVAGAQAAASGKDLFHADATGSVLDKFTGGLNTDNPMAKSTIGLRTEQAGQAKAGAAENYAQAGAANASAAKTRADTARENRSGDIKEVIQPDGTVLLVNKVTGLSRQVVGPDGKPVMARAGKGGPGNMSATLQKELIEADDVANIADQTVATLTNALKLNEKAYSGYGANTRAKIRSNLPGESPEANATVDLNNMIGEQALSGMKAIFGGNPTEGERAILLELQASADKTPAQRKSIIERGIALASRRAKLNKERAKSIRSGTYLTEGPDAPAGASDPLGGGTGPKQISSDAEYNSLPSGAEFIAPDGSHRRKP